MKQNYKKFLRYGLDMMALTLEVTTDADGMLRIRTKDKKSEEYFGTINVSLEPRVASKVADAIKEHC